jgi:hypothetical protein
VKKDSLEVSARTRHAQLTKTVWYVVEKNVARATKILERATAVVERTLSLASTGLLAKPWHADTVKETGVSAVAMETVKKKALVIREHLSASVNQDSLDPYVKREAVQSPPPTG